MAKTVYKVWKWVTPEEWEDGITEEECCTLHSYDDEFITLKRVRELIGDDCRMAQNLPGTEYTMWVDEEGKLKHGFDKQGNPHATQEWQDSAAHHMGWEWLHAHYGGFIWDHDLATGNVVQIIKGKWEHEEEGYIEAAIAYKEEEK